MRDTFLLRPISDDEINILYNLIDETDKDSNYRAKIIMLKDAAGYTVSKIRRATNHHNTNFGKWRQHRFNEKKGIEGVLSRKHVHRPINKITNDIEKKIVVKM